ncbi:unnamed protein product [Oncorhynchus mykiss]|uniref:SOWAHA-C winged helix-turn-helix domain-containing protein n=1 Tax=Oncorhynchus mykiss TaxID=8022 RepID=A0A060XYN5_ONCMY|nr:unnamed protein product [Oncorhynchus mykiss]
MDFTQEAIISLLIEEGGKLKNSELLTKFKDSLNCTDPAEKKQNRDLFKRFVNTVAVVKEIEDVRYIVLKKKYQHLLQETEDVQKSESEEVPEPGEPSPVWNSENNAHSQNGGSEISSENVQEPVITSGELAFKEKVDFKPKRSLNFNIDHTSDAQREYIPSGGAKPFALPLRMPPNLARIEIHKLKSEDDDGSPRRAGSTDQDAHSSSRTKRRPSTMSVGLSSPLPRRAVKITKPSEEPKYTSTVPLEEAEHEWLVRSAAGHWRRVYGLLLRDTQLAEKKDFMSGFTALHWAAKCGNSEMVGSIINISRQGGMDLDVNARTYGGYTPLHIAALHDQEFVLAMLVHEYGADVNIRDNCGKKPYHYLRKGISSEVRELLGEPKVQPQEVLQAEREELDIFPDLSKGLHTISRLFNPHVEKKKKHKQRPSVYLLGVNPRDERDESSSNHRETSDAFNENRSTASRVQPKIKHLVEGGRGPTGRVLGHFIFNQHSL